MNIGKISGINYRSLGVSNKISFKNATPQYVPKEEDNAELLSFMKAKKKEMKDNAPEFGVVLTSAVMGGIILCKLFLGKKY